MKLSFRVGSDRHDRQHGVLAREDPRRDPGRELAQQPVLRMVEVVELLSLWLTSLSLFARQLCGMGGSAISGSTGMPRQPISK
jgi:hypothetical protein